MKRMRRLIAVLIIATVMVGGCSTPQGMKYTKEVYKNMPFANHITEYANMKTCEPTGLEKTIYLDIMEKAFEAYGENEIEKLIPCTENENTGDLQACSRVTSVLAVLLANGRKQEYKGLWERMMDACCKSANMTQGDARVDFSVKEILLAYKAMGASVEKEKLEYWHSELQKINPLKNYVFACRTKSDADNMHNINVYNLVGEFLRETEGMTDATEYLNQHWPIQLARFDENGMYKDPGHPVLYDLTTRCQIQIMLGHGYNGEYLEPLDEKLKEAGLWTLFMQSSAGEFPYGGRSNQYLFNEALIAANCEYEAARYKKLGDEKLAGMFKRSARLAVKSILRWLEETDIPRHIKNFYPVETCYGTEDYGYYSKYMITLGSFIYIAYLFADDTIKECPCPAEVGGYVFDTSKAFHKVFANCQGHSIEIDTRGDKHYDSTGLGRYHYSGIHTELALSMPFAAEPGYVLPEGVQIEDLAIGAGWDAGNGAIQFLSSISNSLRYRLTVLEEKPDIVKFTVEYSGSAFKGCNGIIETYTLDESGVHIECEFVQPTHSAMYFRIPVFLTNGRDSSVIQCSGNRIYVKLGSSVYAVASENGISLMDQCRLANRNGEYGIAYIKSAGGRISVKLTISEAK